MSRTHSPSPSRNTPLAAPRRVRLKDISTRADLSVSTVSMALADHPTISRKTKQRVVEICRELGYRKAGAAGHLASLIPAQPLKDKLISFVMMKSRFDDPAYAPILHSMAHEAQLARAQLHIAPAPDTDSASVHRWLTDQATRSDAVILLGIVPDDALELLKTQRVPFVMMGLLHCPIEKPLPQGVTIVAPDELAMGKLAAASLLAAGHRRIAFLCEVVHQGLSHHQWLQGYRLAHLEKNVPMDDALTLITGHVHSSAAHAVQTFASLEKPPTALIVPDIPLAKSFIDLWHAAGRSLAPHAVIAGGHPQRAAAYNMNHTGRIFCDPYHLVRATFDTLAAKLQGRDHAGQSILLHPTCLNLPQPLHPI